MRIRSIVPFCIPISLGFCFLTVAYRTAAEQSREARKLAIISPVEPDIAPARIIGKWYMGTMMGVDCNLSIDADHTMTIQTGGCFHQDPPVKLNWSISGNKLFWAPHSIQSFISGARLKKGFGSYLSIVNVGKNTVIVPQRAESKIKRNGYDYEYCFWRNLLGDDGLELPKEAKAIHHR